jgi:hypothetical protein
MYLQLSMNNSRRRWWRVWSVSFHAPEATTSSVCSGLKGLGRGAAQLQSQARYVRGADANCAMQYTGDGRQRQELRSHDRYSWEGRNEIDVGRRESDWWQEKWAVDTWKTGQWVVDTCKENPILYWKAISEKEIRHLSECRELYPTYDAHHFNCKLIQLKWWPQWVLYVTTAPGWPWHLFNRLQLQQLTT